jgi:hypothetical protein
MNRQAFYAALRARNNGAFGTALSQRQVEGIEALLDAGAGLPLHHMANVLAQVYRETGGGMYPVKETVMPHHKDKNPSDAEVIARLDRAFAAGRLPHVRAPYWREGYFGRGVIQLTHRQNYAKFGITNPDDALRPATSAHIAVTGMRDGVFTGRKLADFVFPEALDLPPIQNPRRIVNGRDGSDEAVATLHRMFAGALTAAGWTGAQRPAQRPSAPVAMPPPDSPRSAVLAFLAWLAGVFIRRPK